MRIRATAIACVMALGISACGLRANIDVAIHDPDNGGKGILIGTAIATGLLAGTCIMLWLVNRKDPEETQRRWDLQAQIDTAWADYLSCLDDDEQPCEHYRLEKDTILERCSECTDPEPAPDRSTSAGDGDDSGDDDAGADGDATGSSNGGAGATSGRDAHHHTTGSHARQRGDHGSGGARGDGEQGDGEGDIDLDDDASSTGGSTTTSSSRSTTHIDVSSPDHSCDAPRASADEHNARALQDADAEAARKNEDHDDGVSYYASCTAQLRQPCNIKWAICTLKTEPQPGELKNKEPPRCPPGYYWVPCGTPRCLQKGGPAKIIC